MTILNKLQQTSNTRISYTPNEFDNDPQAILIYEWDEPIEFTREELQEVNKLNNTKHMQVDIIGETPNDIYNISNGISPRKGTFWIEQTPFEVNKVRRILLWISIDEHNLVND